MTSVSSSNLFDTSNYQDMSGSELAVLISNQPMLVDLSPWDKFDYSEWVFINDSEWIELTDEDWDRLAFYYPKLELRQPIKTIDILNVIKSAFNLSPLRSMEQ